MSYIYQHSDSDPLFQLNLIYFNKTSFCILYANVCVCVCVLHPSPSLLQLWNGLQSHLGSTLIAKDYYHKNVKVED
jgi:hypothetical protein